MKERRIRILAIPGSLRKASYNRALLVAAKREAPEAIEVEVYEDGLRIPLFNQDSEGDLTPQVVLELRERIRSADAVLIAAPEYNSSITGVLKNLIDWASRPYGESSFTDKPVSVVGASPTRFGAERSQETTITVLKSARARIVGRHASGQGSGRAGRRGGRYQGPGDVGDAPAGVERTGWECWFRLTLLMQGCVGLMRGTPSPCGYPLSETFA